MLRPRIVTAPAATPVDLDDVKEHVAAPSGGDDDALLTAMIGSATGYLDGWSGILGRALITQTWAQDFAGFTTILRLPVGPVASVSSVTYIDVDGVQQTLSASEYTLFTDAAGSYIAPSFGTVWPATRTQDDAVTVTYVAGADNCPDGIRAAILAHIGVMYDARHGDSASEIPAMYWMLVAPYRRVSF